MHNPGLWCSYCFQNQFQQKRNPLKWLNQAARCHKSSKKCEQRVWELIFHTSLRNFLYQSMHTCKPRYLQGFLPFFFVGEGGTAFTFRICYVLFFNIAFGTKINTIRPDSADSGFDKNYSACHKSET